MKPFFGKPSTTGYYWLRLHGKEGHDWKIVYWHAEDSDYTYSGNERLFKVTNSTGYEWIGPIVVLAEFQ
jgi:hypothetical protein